MPLWWSNDLDLHATRSKSCDLLAHAVADAREHCGSTTEDNVAIQVLSDINITLHDGVAGCLMDSKSFYTVDAQ